MKSQAETPHEQHNRLAYELGLRILTEVPDTINQIIILESIVSGIISMFPYKDEKSREKALDFLLDEITTAVRKRVLEKPLVSRKST
jgi:hypothetical protein